ncbi:NAD(P)-dependent oxidoreductase [Undibacter mobilis]|uniref:NAD(P)-dependent oxidoreductase n=1 Tax=Undibacter mobilis TaxID=2292256 RepID=A0A371B7G6_9BRAD|nr:NAD(P)-dependent oxidoreductase [Undibacter mobilis]RDV03311.1 NAD(P)-dependent oxidoreductase [Undibacter mobilis]
MAKTKKTSKASKRSKKRAVARQSKGTVGIVGLGIMGGAFARHLKKAGWRVVGYDLSAARRLAAKDRGITILRNATEVAKQAPVVLTSLPSPKALESVVHEIAGAKLPPITLVELSTFALADKLKAERRMRKAKHTMLDVPVSGTGAQAARGDIVFYASGYKAAIKRLRPMFADFGRAAYDVGAFGNGSKMKYVANLLVAIHNVASAEAMVLGMKAGLPPLAILELVSAGAGQSRIFDLRGPMMVKNDYDVVTASLDVFDKDLKLIGDFVRATRVPTPVFDATRPVYDKAIKSGLGAKDAAAVCAVVEKMARLKRDKTVKAPKTTGLRPQATD